MVSEIVTLALAWIAGVLLGGVFFGGLWWTVRKALYSPLPAVWFLGSLLLRMGITLAGFYLVGQGDWRRLVTCLAGFVMARLVVMRLPLTRDRLGLDSGQEEHHAPQS
jgi:F1F0 ATPase subunit 2